MLRLKKLAGATPGGKVLWEDLKMSDEIIEELWRIKDSIAREHGYDIEALVAYLQSKEKAEGRQVVDLSAIKKTAEQGASSAIKD